MKSIYIAGFDVFDKNRDDIFSNIRLLCALYGYDALVPMDAVATTSKDIFKSNIALINKADHVIANLNAFRGKELDSGTVFEVGYAYALGKQVFGYTSITDWANHIGFDGVYNHSPICKDGFYIENFGLPLNLMLAESITIVNGNFIDALKALITNTDVYKYLRQQRIKLKLFNYINKLMRLFK